MENKLKFEELSNDEKLVIAEFIYGYETDTLIKSEGQRVIDLFAKKGFDVSKVKLQTFSLMTLIKMHFDFIQRGEIMKLYISGKL